MAAAHGWQGRFIVVLLLKLLAFYARHETNVNIQLDGRVVAALTTLADLLPVIESYLIPGPE